MLPILNLPHYEIAGSYTDADRGILPLHRIVDNPIVHNRTDSVGVAHPLLWTLFGVLVAYAANRLLR